MLVETCDNSTQKFVLIDTIQRLGVAYHFHNEIETSIQNIFDSQLQSENNNDNLYVVALRFRLLRQQGHYISSGKHALSLHLLSHNKNQFPISLVYNVIAC